MRIEGITVLVLSRSNFARASAGVYLKDGVGRSVNIGIDAHTEQMLVVVCVDTRIDFCAPTFGVLARVYSISIQDPGKFDLELYSTILMKDPVHRIFVIGCRKDVGDDEFTTSGNDDGVIAEIGVFEEDASIFFVDANGVLDCLRSSSTIDKVGIHVMNGTFTIAA